MFESSHVPGDLTSAQFSVRGSTTDHMSKPPAGNKNATLRPPQLRLRIYPDRTSVVIAIIAILAALLLPSLAIQAKG